jgi:hypothetical protein
VDPPHFVIIILILVCILYICTKILFCLGHILAHLKMAVKSCNKKCNIFNIKITVLTDTFTQLKSYLKGTQVRTDMGRQRCTVMLAITAGVHE